MVLKLSGGQRQKIAMVRAFAKESKVLILNETTSSFDNKSESYVNELPSNSLDGKTVIIITHKLQRLNQLTG